MESIIKILKKIYRKVRRLDPPKGTALWNKKTDEAKRYQYDLNENSVVFDLGGYEGAWTSNIFAMYCPTVYVFEPVKSFYGDIKKRFEKNKKIFVYQYGLSNTTKKIKINLNNNASSEFANGEKVEEVSLIKAVDFFKQNNIIKIDLMKINIEGGEYDLLDSLIETGFIKNIKNIQVQFHRFVPEAEVKMEKIQEKLALTHQTTYAVPWYWENWELRKQNDNR
jgi:FkbM family methyltransferase